MKKKIKNILKKIVFRIINIFQKKYIVANVHQPPFDYQLAERMFLSIKESDTEYLKNQKLFLYKSGDIYQKKDINIMFYENVYVDMFNAIAINNDLEVIIETKKYEKMREATTFSKISSFDNFEDEVVFLVNPSLNAQYFHIWFDGLIKLYYINKIKSVKPTIVIYKDAPPLYSQVLNCFDGLFTIKQTNSRFIKVKKYGLVKIQYWTKHAPIFSIQMRDFFLQHLYKNASNENILSDKFYIKRKTRPISNAIEIELILINKGFELVYLEELNIFEQIRLFNRAKYIVGLHGAGFTNLIFSKPGTKVLELQNFAIVPTYYFLSMQLNLSYFYLLPNEFDFNKICNPYTDNEGFYNQKILDVSFNKEKFSSILDLMLNEKN